MIAGSTLKTSLFLVWVTLVSGVLMAIYQQDKFFAVDLKPIAFLSAKTGSVMVRPEGLVRWAEIGEKYGFADGDRVATARGSTSKIQFGPGRTLVMDEETQIQVSSISLSHNKDFAFTINLLRGSMVAEVDNKCGNCAPLIVQAGRERVNLSSGKTLGIYKAVGQKAEKFDPKGPRPVVKRPIELAALEQTFVQPTPPPAPIPAPPPVVIPKPKSVTKPIAPQPVKPAPAVIAAAPALLPSPPVQSPSAKGLEVEIVTPVKVWATLQSVANLEAGVEVALNVPQSTQAQGAYQPLVEISGADGKNGSEVLDQMKKDEKVLRLSGNLIKRRAVVSRKGNVNDYVFFLRGGGRLLKSDQGDGVDDNSNVASESFAAQKQEYHLKSYAEVVDGPKTLGFDQLRLEQGGPNVFTAPLDIPVEQAAISIFLLNSSDYAKIMPFVRGAKAVGIRAGGELSADGIYVVRDKKITAQLRGGINSESANAILNAIGGDYVFRGARASLYDAIGKSQTDVVDYVGALLEKGQVLYILKRNKIYPVSRDFVKTNTEVAKFIDSQAKAVFLERVEIIAYR